MYDKILKSFITIFTVKKDNNKNKLCKSTFFNQILHTNTHFFLGTSKLLFSFFSSLLSRLL